MKNSNVIINYSIPFHFEDIQKIFHDAYGKNINEFTFINDNEKKEINETNYDDQFFNSNFNLILSEQKTKKKILKNQKNLLIKIKIHMMKKKKRTTIKCRNK